MTQAVGSGLFDFMAHPDLVKKFGHRPQGDLRPFYKDTLDAIEAAGVAMEVSTAGLRKEVMEIYPSKVFLEEALKRNIPILISSDAHAPQEVGYEFNRASLLLKEVGYREINRFIGRKRISVPLR
jgi:histidinol-phosphatase (PHP family)